MRTTADELRSIARFISGKLNRAAGPVTTLLLHAPELGNTQIREGLLEMMLVMARSEDYIQQLVASEAIIAAASKKKDVTVIVQQGTDILKTLYKSSNDHIKVRALVGLCKLGARNLQQT